MYLNASDLACEFYIADLYKSENTLAVASWIQEFTGHHIIFIKQIWHLFDYSGMSALLTLPLYFLSVSVLRVFPLSASSSRAITSNLRWSSYIVTLSTQHICLEKYQPWMKKLICGSQVDFGRRHLTAHWLHLNLESLVPRDPQQCARLHQVHLCFSYPSFFFSLSSFLLPSRPSSLPLSLPFSFFLPSFLTLSLSSL